MNDKRLLVLAGGMLVAILLVTGFSGQFHSDSSGSTDGSHSGYRHSSHSGHSGHGGHGGHSHH